VAFSGTATAPVNSPGAQLPITSRVALNLNSATTEQLLALPGIGPAKAAAILRYRSEHGPFSKPEDLSRVSGFGPSALLRLQGLITAP
jgi:competence protein ComEA